MDLPEVKNQAMDFLHIKEFDMHALVEQYTMLIAVTQNEGKVVVTLEYYAIDPMSHANVACAIPTM